ncbi:MAG: tetratricopeptide repeat protein [Candidatus Bathyarchaeota archaeon]|nr:tetratricopeptide repeat protein [Candidatus Bathyarchaeota archaeon]
MIAERLLKEGKLDAAVESVSDQLRARPLDSKLRMALFELLCFQGQFDRAIKQLDAIESASRDPGFALSAHYYRSLLAAEQLRGRVFEGDALPEFPVEPPENVEGYVLFVKRIQSGDPGLGEAVEKLESATPSMAGELNGESFAHIRDGDDRVASVLEAFWGEKYLWLPFEQIEELEIQEPKRLLDLFWARAKLSLKGLTLGDVLLPVIYPKSFAEDDESIRLGRKTVWRSSNDQFVYGVGRKSFLVDDEQVSITEIRSLQMKCA